MAVRQQTREREIEEDRDQKDAEKDVKSLLDEKDDDDEVEDGKPTIVREELRDREVEDDQDARLAYDVDEEGDGEHGAQERDSRRKRRNRARRAAQEQSNATIAALNERVQQLSGVVDQMSRGQVGFAASDLDQRIQSEQQRLEVIDNAMAKAIKDADDVTYKQALHLQREATGRLQQLGFAKQRLIAETGGQQQRQNNGMQQTRQGAQAPDPRAVKFSERFMERHDWFDPTDPSDEDSMIVKAIDDALANEGYRPNTKMYWVELERRVKARGVGPNGNDDGGEDVDDDNQEDDRGSQRRAAPRGPGGLPPRSGRNGGREAGGRRTFALTPFMRETLDSEGLLDEKSLTKEQREYRTRLVKTWEKGTKEAASAGGRR